MFVSFLSFKSERQKIIIWSAETLAKQAHSEYQEKNYYCTVVLIMFLYCCLCV